MKYFLYLQQLTIFFNVFFSFSMSAVVMAMKSTIIMLAIKITALVVVAMKAATMDPTKKINMLGTQVAMMTMNNHCMHVIDFTTTVFQAAWSKKQSHNMM